MRLKILEANKIISSESALVAPCSPNTTTTYPFPPKKTVVSIFMACLSVFLLTGCTDNPDQSLSNSSQEDAEQTRQRPLKKVNVMTIEPQIISMANELPGRVEAFKTAEIRPQVSGIIQSRFF